MARPGDRGRDDSWHANWIAEQGAELVRGEGRVLRKGVVAVGEREIEYGNLVVATGSSPAVPPVDGLDEVEFWTNREGVWANAVPESLVVLGGGPVGAELAQFFHRLGSRVTILESHDRLLARLDPVAGTLLGERFGEEGIDVRVEVQAKRVERGGHRVRVELASGDASKPRSFSSRRDDAPTSKASASSSSGSS